MNDQTDSQLLRAYSEKRSEAAFTELVRRHVDFVYSAARRMVADPHLAEDVTQSVFVAVAKNARQLTNHSVLSGWLHRTAQNIAGQTMRTINRRRAREQEAFAMNELIGSDSEPAWNHIAPHLDDALGELSEPDRDALLLRFFERKSAREMARTLGVSEEAAQKRANRAIDRLRDILAKRGMAVGASGIVVAMSANAVQIAPVGLAATISTATIVAGTAIPSSTTLLSTKAIVMTTLQKTLLTAGLAAAVGTGLYQAHQTSRLREEIRALQQQQAEKGRQLEREREEAANRLAIVMSENERFKSNTAELLKLRGEIGKLRAKEQASLGSTKEAGNATGIATEAANRNLPKASWTDAGFSTPLAALQTRGWAVLNADRDKFKQSIFISDGARTILMDMFDKMAAANPKEAQVWAEQGLKNKWGLEEGFLMPMVAENRDKGYAGYRVLSEKTAAPDETVMEVETQMVSAPARKETLKLHRFGDDWKFVIDEDFLKKQFEQQSK